MPFYILFPTVRLTITYFAVGFQADLAKYLNAVLVMVLLNLNGMSMGLVLATLFRYRAQPMLKQLTRRDPNTRCLTIKLRQSISLVTLIYSTLFLATSR